MLRLKSELESIYRQYNRPEFIAPDPLAPVLEFTDPRDQEVVALVSASLAFGNVKTILASTARVLAILPDPPRALGAVAESRLRKQLTGFRHRYSTGEEMASMLAGAADALREHGSLAAAFDVDWRASGGVFEEALSRFANRLRRHSAEKNYLLPDPALGSACKRWMMYLRWMVRRDAVDPGCWQTLGCSLKPAHLLVPVDTHMLRVATALHFTQRQQGSLLTAREITGHFRKVCPRDPVRYDFCLTRLGIRRAPEMDALLEWWRGEEWD